MKIKNKITFSSLVSTCLCIGYFPFAPGTIGSFLAFPIYFVLASLLVIAKGKLLFNIASLEILNLMFFITVLLFFIGAWATEKYTLEKKSQDPKEVIIDEIVAQMLAIGLTISLLKFLDAASIAKIHKLGLSDASFFFINMLASLVFFRVFDITKPWPINYIDQKIKSGIGVMLDDVLAAIFAVVVHFFVLFAILDRVNL